MVGVQRFRAEYSGTGQARHERQGSQQQGF